MRRFSEAGQARLKLRSEALQNRLTAAHGASRRAGHSGLHITVDQLRNIEELIRDLNTALDAASREIEIAYS